MRDNRLLPPVRFRISASFTRSSLIRRLMVRQAICIALISSLLFLPGSSYAFAQAPLLASTLVRVAVLPFTPIVSILTKLFQPAARAQETTADRTARVLEIHIEPGKLVGYLNQQVSFSAVGLDRLGKPAHGARFSWSSSDELTG